MDIAVVKLDGSLLTEGSAAQPRVNVGHVYALAEAVRGRAGILLVHGSGAFGQAAALAHGRLHGPLARETPGLVTGASVSLEELHRQVVAVLRISGIPAFPVQAAHAFAWAGGVTLHAANTVRALLARGLVPVVASGHVPDEDTGGFAVASSDALAATAAIALQARRLVLATHSDAAARARAPHCGQHPRGRLAHGYEAARQGVTTLVVDGTEPRNLAAALQGGAFVGARLLAPRSPEIDDCYLGATRTSI